MSDIPDHLQETYQMLKCAFPNGIAESEYMTVIRLLHPHMSYRTLARVLVPLTNKPHSLILNDTMGFEIDLPTDIELLENTRQKLIPCGYEKWMLGW